MAMANRPWLLAVVVLLVVSSLAVLAAPAARATPLTPTVRGSAPHPAFSTLQMYTSSGECPYCNITSYTTGTADGSLGANILYFAIYDPTADKSINFTITDPNAARDGVPQPAYHVEVPNNATTFSYYSAETGLSYTFPASVKIGGNWVVNATAPLGGSVSYNITVRTYLFEAGGTPYPYTIVLPEERINTVWDALSLVNLSPATQITNVGMDGYYFGANGTEVALFAKPLNLGSSPLGNTTWKVPANATWNSDIVITLWADINVSGHIAENESETVYYIVGEVVIESFFMYADSPNFCGIYSGYQQYFYSGSYVQVCALVGAFGGYDQFTPVAGLPVAIHFWNGTKIVTPPGNPPTSLVSNATGIVAFSFYADSPQFSTYYQYPFYNSVNLTVTDPGAAPVPANRDFVAWGNYSFYMEPSENAVGVTVTLNQLAYFPGQAITATWTLNSNSTRTGPLTATEWYDYADATGYFLGQGTISSTASTGTIALSLPSGFIGGFTIEVLAANATSAFAGEASAVVETPTLALNPSSTAFSPGQSISITAIDWGASALGSGAAITYQVYAEYGYPNYGGHGLVASGTVANDSSFTISVPSSGAPSSYEIYAYLGSPAAGTVASAVLTLNQSFGYNVIVGVSTLSKYSDGSFQPGETISVTYQISPYGNAPLPVVYTFHVALAGTQLGGLVSTTSTSGSFPLTIPSSWPSGIVFIEIVLNGTYLTGNSCFEGTCSGMTAITVNANPSVLSLDLSPGTGLTLGWLILFLIILLVVIVGLVLWVRHRRSHSPAPPPSGGTPPANVTEPMSPPAPAPSTPAAAEWKEPPAPEEGQPPLPTPPPGAT